MSLDIMSIIIESTSRSFHFTSWRRPPPDSERYSSTRSASPGPAHAQHEFTRPTHGSAGSARRSLERMPTNTAPPRSLRRAIAAAAAALLLAAGGLLVASPASAHDELVSTDPAADTTLEALPAAAHADLQRRARDRPGRHRTAGDGCRGHVARGRRSRVEGTVVTQPLSGRGIRRRHRAVEGRLERRAPDLGRVRLHRDRAADADAHGDGDALRRADGRAPTERADRRRRRRLRCRSTAAAPHCRGSSAACSLLAAIGGAVVVPAGLASAPHPRRRGAARERRRGRCGRPVDGSAPRSEPPADR